MNSNNFRGKVVPFARRTRQERLRSCVTTIGDNSNLVMVIDAVGKILGLRNEFVAQDGVVIQLMKI